MSHLQPNPDPSRETGVRPSGSFRALVRTIATAAITLAFAAACGDDDPTEPPIVPDGPLFEYPASPDSLVQAYRDAYEFRNAAKIDSLLAPGFVFTFEETERDSFGVGATWSRTEEMESTRRFFDGEEGVWPDGRVHAPVNPFPFKTALDPADESEWVLDEATGCYTRPYVVSFMQVTYTDFDNDFISGTQLFEVADMSTRGGPDGRPASGYAIVGWKDLGMQALPVPSDSGAHGLASHPRHLATWSFLKATFRQK